MCRRKWFEYSVHVEARDRVFRRIAVATEELQTLIGNVALHFTTCQLKHGGFIRREFICRVFIGALLVKRTVNSHLSFDVSKLKTRVLELSDLLSEGFSFFYVINGDVQSAL